MGQCVPTPSKIFLHLQIYGTNGQTTTVDSSSYANTMINGGGGASISTSSPKFGTGSGSFPQSVNAGWLTPVTPGAELDISQIDFTIAFWFNPGSSSASVYDVPIFVFDQASENTYSILGNFHVNGSSSYFYFESYFDGSPGPSALSGYVPSTYSGWSHVVFQVTSGQAAVAVNGVWGTSVSWAYSPVQVPSDTYFIVGTQFQSSEQSSIYASIDEFIVYGGSLYTIGTSFTPPTDPYDGSSCVTVPTVNVYGKFVGANNSDGPATYPPTLLIDAGNIEPRVWRPKDNTTIVGQR